MELHTLGVDGGYTQKDIIEVAKCFTGWTIADPQGYRTCGGEHDQGRRRSTADRLQRQAGVPDDLESGDFISIALARGRPQDRARPKDRRGRRKGRNEGHRYSRRTARNREVHRHVSWRSNLSATTRAMASLRVADAFHRSNGDIKTTLKALFTRQGILRTRELSGKDQDAIRACVKSIAHLGRHERRPGDARDAQQAR